MPEISVDYKSAHCVKSRGKEDVNTLSHHHSGNKDIIPDGSRARIQKIPCTLFC